MQSLTVTTGTSNNITFSWTGGQAEPPAFNASVVPLRPLPYAPTVGIAIDVPTQREQTACAGRDSGYIPALEARQ